MTNRYHIRCGDSAELLCKLQSESIDALVCDPPAGISFMNKAWDHDHGHRDEWIKAFASIFKECLRVMKPGAHGLVWALPRTSHWTATALEDAGFEIRDVVMHLFGTGFPKSLDVSKAIDKMQGAEREVTGVERRRPNPRAMMPGGAGLRKTDAAARYDAPATELGARHSGWGTALKPAAEHWILVRKPLIGTVADNVLAHGTGGINIDGCRIGNEGGTASDAVSPNYKNQVYGRGMGGLAVDPSVQLGRWPAHVTLDEEAAAMLDAQSGERPSGAMRAGQPRVKTMNGGGYHGGFKTDATEKEIEASSGGASRFFYVAKASRSDRGEDNKHPTVKSTALMRWLCRLITPPGGIILDPFMGSGSTGVAALQEGFQFIGVEREMGYFEIARRRLEETGLTP